MNDHYAMDYEMVIRKAFYSARSLTKGADADIFRKYCRASNLLEKDRHAIQHNEPRISVHPIEEVEDQARRAKATVVGHLQNAIAQVKRTHDDVLTDVQRERLDGYLNKLHRPSHQEIEEVIDEANAVFQELNLSMQ